MRFVQSECIRKKESLALLPDFFIHGNRSSSYFELRKVLMLFFSSFSQIFLVSSSISQTPSLRRSKSICIIAVQLWFLYSIKTALHLISPPWIFYVVCLYFADGMLQLIQGGVNLSLVFLFLHSLFRQHSVYRIIFFEWRQMLMFKLLLITVIPELIKRYLKIEQKRCWNS